MTNGTFCTQMMSISISKTLSMHKIAGYGQRKIIRTCTSTASFNKGNCVVRVDSIFYCRAILILGSAGSITGTINNKRYESL